MKTIAEWEEIGNKMKLDDFLVLPNPNDYTHDKSYYLKLKYTIILRGFAKNKLICIEDKIKACKHVSKLIGWKSLSDEDIIQQIEKIMNEA